MNVASGPFNTLPAHLFETACTSCTVKEICGEAHAPWACPADPEAFGDDFIHPIRDGGRLLQELLMPPVRGTWASLPPGVAFIPVTTLTTEAPSARDLHSVLSYRPRARAKIALLTGSDADLQRLWNSRGRWVRRIAERYILAVGPTYSNWLPDPPIHGLVAIRRSAEISRLLADKIPTIPGVTWRTRLDIHRYVAWFRECWPGSVHVYFSTLKDHVEWLSFLDGLRYLATHLSSVGPLPSLLAQGPSKVHRIEGVLDAWPGQVAFATEHPGAIARHGLRLNGDLSETPDQITPFDQLEAANIRTFEETVRKLIAKRDRDKHVPREESA